VRLQSGPLEPLAPEVAVSTRNDVSKRGFDDRGAPCYMLMESRLLG